MGGGLLICRTTCASLHKHSSLPLKQLKHVEVAQRAAGRAGGKKKKKKTQTQTQTLLFFSIKPDKISGSGTVQEAAVSCFPPGFQGDASCLSMSKFSAAAGGP